MFLRFILISFFIFLSGCASPPEAVHPSGLVIKELTPDKSTMLTKQNLLHLAQVYDLSPFLFTKQVYLKTDVENKSHPILTLNTKHAEVPLKILSDFLHEQIHWWLTKNPLAVSGAKAELKKIYPKAPPFGTVEETYEDMIVCYVQLKALEFYLGKKQGKELLIQIMKKDKRLAWAYYQVIHKDFAIKKVINKHKLLPPPLS